MNYLQLSRLRTYTQSGKKKCIGKPLYKEEKEHLTITKFLCRLQYESTILLFILLSIVNKQHKISVNDSYRNYLSYSTENVSTNLLFY